MGGFDLVCGGVIGNEELRGQDYIWVIHKNMEIT